MGDFDVEIGHREQTVMSFERALALTPSNAEKKLLQSKIENVKSRGSMVPSNEF